MAILVRPCHRHRDCQMLIRPNWYLVLGFPRFRTHQCFSSGTDSTSTEFPTENAYKLLGVLESSSSTEIKAAFRKLAKETHPDLAASKNNSAASRRFVQILAAYEILSDSEKRAHYDRYLLAHKQFLQKNSVLNSKLHFRSHVTTFKEMEVVEWLKWYRLAINDIVSGKKVVFGTGYFDVLERDLYSAIHAAYYGPELDSMELLPDCFEAEERSVRDTPEILHLVSGRDLFGMVCLANKVSEISYVGSQKLTSFRCMVSHSGLPVGNMKLHVNSQESVDHKTSGLQASDILNYASDAYRDLELHVSGRIVAVASRFPPKSISKFALVEDSEDHIHVFLNGTEDSGAESNVYDESHLERGMYGYKIPLGTITGLGTSPEEGSCYVYNSSGAKTHVIMKHRTLLVKHLHWYHIGEKVSVCECRCTRARLPPSKFWLFEPRCGLHDTGGWYVETYGRDKKGRTVPSQRFWDLMDAAEHSDERLHPAMYLLALAYRTLDIEDAKIKKRTFAEVFEGRLVRLLHWCKRLL